MLTIGQKAERVMLTLRPCEIRLKNGRVFNAEKIESLSITIIGTNSGDITIQGGEKIILDDIADITQIGQMAQEIMRLSKPCKIKLISGEVIEANKLVRVSITIVGPNAGTLTIEGGKTVLIDEVSELITN